MTLSIIYTTCTRNGFKKLQCERTFILCKTSFEKRHVFKCWKCSGVKVWQSHVKEIIELIIRNSLIERLFNLHAVFSNSDRKRYYQKRPATLLKKRLWHEFWEISKNTFCYRTPPEAASVYLVELLLYVVEEKLQQ